MAPILIIFSNLGLGGVQKKIVDIVNELSIVQHNLPIYILLRKKGSFDLSREINNRNVDIIYYTDSFKVKTPLFFPFFVLYKIWQLKPCAVLSFLSPFSLPVLLAKLLFFWRKFKIVVSEDYYTSEIIQYLKYSKLNHVGIRVLYPKADVIITQTLSVKKDLIITYNIPKEKIKIIPNWTNLYKAKISDTYKTYDMIYTGRFAKSKQINVLLLGLIMIKKFNKDVKLALIGDGEERENLVEYIKRNNLQKNVEFLGIKYDVENFLKKSKIFAYASQSKAEGFPLAILEAMAMGTPVLTSRFAGAEEIIKDDENGYTYNDLDEFVKKTLLLLNNSSLRNSVASKAKKYVMKYNSTKNIRYYFKYLGIRISN